MFGFRRKKTREQQEATIKAIQEDTFKKIDKSNRSTQKLIDLFVTENIFEAIGGKRRSKR